MSYFSFPSLIANALGANKGWTKQWAKPEPKTKYDVIIVGAGGHGLAAAYYLAKEHNITNVAVLEKAGWAAATRRAIPRLSAPATCAMKVPNFMSMRLVFGKVWLRKSTII